MHVCTVSSVGKDVTLVLCVNSKSGRREALTNKTPQLRTSKYSDIVEIGERGRGEVDGVEDRGQKTDIER